jgi:hypothetical protein
VCLFLDEFEEAINACSGNSWYGVLALFVGGGRIVQSLARRSKRLGP